VIRLLRLKLILIAVVAVPPTVLSLAHTVSTISMSGNEPESFFTFLNRVRPKHEDPYLHELARRDFATVYAMLQRMRPTLTQKAYDFELECLKDAMHNLAVARTIYANEQEERKGKASFQRVPMPKVADKSTGRQKGGNRKKNKNMIVAVPCDKPLSVVCLTVASYVVYTALPKPDPPVRPEPYVVEIVIDAIKATLDVIPVDVYVVASTPPAEPIVIPPSVIVAICTALMWYLVMKGTRKKYLWSSDKTQYL
jgi:hypothetical protein